MGNIAKNEYYELSFDDRSHQVLWIMKKFWDSMDVVPNFFSDWDKLMESIRGGFTMLADLSEVKTWPEDVYEANIKIQEKLMKKGCKKVAVVIQSTIVKFQVKQATELAGMLEVVRMSENLEDAKAWLEEKK
jgi:hypothetical protein